MIKMVKDSGANEQRLPLGPDITSIATDCDSVIMIMRIVMMMAMMMLLMMVMTIWEGGSYKPGSVRTSRFSHVGCGSFHSAHDHGG